MAIHHVTLEVPPAEVERAAEFWTLLGFEPVPAPPQVASYATWLEREGQQIHLLHTEEATAPALGHAAVVAPEFERTLAALEAAGFEVERTRELWGAARAYGIAPAGHRVELMAAPPEPATGPAGA